MSDLSKLAGKAEKVKIGDLELEIKPLTVSNMELLMKVSDDKDADQQVAAIRDLISKVLKDSIPDCTDEEIDNIDIKYMQKIVEEIMKVNQLEIDKDKAELMKRLKNG